MDIKSIPIIVLCCYVLGELYKLIFKDYKNSNKILPVIMAIIGGILGILIYYTNPEVISDANNVWIALGIGIASVVSSTYTNKIIKQIFKKGDK